jgi:hypothetical protein
MTEKTTSHIDTRVKVCYDCSSTKVVFIVDKKYYCPTCALNNQRGYNHGSNKRKEIEQRGGLKLLIVLCGVIWQVQLTIIL